MKKKGTNPAFLFFPSDWNRDVNLQMASTQTKGVWIQLLTNMWFAPTRGMLTGTIEEIATLTRCTIREIEKFLIENDERKFANIEVCFEENGASLELNRDGVNADKCDEKISQKSHKNLTKISLIISLVRKKNLQVSIKNRRMYRIAKRQKDGAIYQARRLGALHWQNHQHQSQDGYYRKHFVQPFIHVILHRNKK